MPPWSRIAAIVSANVMPRVISSSRNSPMTSPWSSVLISSPGMTTRSRVSRELDRLERAAEDVVVGHGDAAEPDRLGVVEQILGRDRAVVRPLGMKVEVERDPVAIREWIDGLAAWSPALAHELRVDAHRARLRPPRSSGSPRACGRRGLRRRGRGDRRRDARPRALLRRLSRRRVWPRRQPPRVRAALLRPAPRRRSPRRRAPRPAARSCAWSGRARESAAGAVSPGESRAASCGAAWPPSRARSRGAGEERVSSRGRRLRARSR